MPTIIAAASCCRDRRPMPDLWPCTPRRTSRPGPGAARPASRRFCFPRAAILRPVRTRMIGDHHVSNCLAAAAVGLALGIDWQTIVRGMEAVERVPGRLERLECGQPFSVFVDAASSPESLALAIKTVRQVTRGRVMIVFGPGRRRRRAAGHAGPRAGARRAGADYHQRRAAANRAAEDRARHAGWIRAGHRKLRSSPTAPPRFALPCRKPALATRV